MQSSSTGQIELSQAAAQLKVPKRRIYDITNVLEGIGYIIKKSKNLIVLKGSDDSFQQEHEQMQGDLGELMKEEAMLDVWISRCRHLQHEPNEHRYVIASDIHSCYRHEGREASDQGNGEHLGIGISTVGGNRSLLAIHAPPDSLVQVSSSSSEEERDMVSQQQQQQQQQPGKHQLLVSSTGTDLDEILLSENKKQKSSSDPVQVYWVPQSGSPAKALADHPMVKLLLPPSDTTTIQSKYAVLEREEGVSDFF
jgi:hypothetical protein